MVVTARRNKRGLVAVELCDLETEDAAIKIECALQDGHFEVDMANRDARVQRTHVTYSLETSAAKVFHRLL